MNPLLKRHRLAVNPVSPITDDMDKARKVLIRKAI